MQQIVEQKLFIFRQNFLSDFLSNPKSYSPISKFLIYDFLLIKPSPNKFGFSEKAAQIFGFGKNIPGKFRAQQIVVQVYADISLINYRHFAYKLQTFHR